MMKTNISGRGRAGFTVIELMMVVLIIAILIALVVSLAGLAGRKTDNAHAKADLELIKNWLENQRVDSGRYPDTLTGYAGEKTDPWGRPFQYEVETNKRLTYRLWSTGPIETDPSDDVNLSGGQM